MTIELDEEEFNDLQLIQNNNNNKSVNFSQEDEEEGEISLELNNNNLSNELNQFSINQSINPNFNFNNNPNEVENSLDISLNNKSINFSESNLVSLMHDFGNVSFRELEGNLESNFIGCQENSKEFITEEEDFGNLLIESSRHDFTRESTRENGFNRDNWEQEKEEENQNELSLSFNESIEETNHVTENNFDEISNDFNQSQQSIEINHIDNNHNHSIVVTGMSNSNSPNHNHSNEFNSIQYQPNSTQNSINSPSLVNATLNINPSHSNNTTISKFVPETPINYNTNSSSLNTPTNTVTNNSCSLLAEIQKLKSIITNQQSQIQTLNTYISSTDQEKELELLQLKSQLLKEHEVQLEQLRSEFSKDKQELCVKYESDLRCLRGEVEKEREEYECCLSELRQRLYDYKIKGDNDSKGVNTSYYDKPIISDRKTTFSASTNTVVTYNDLTEQDNSLNKLSQENKRLIEEVERWKNRVDELTRNFALRRDASTSPIIKPLHQLPSPLNFTKRNYEEEYNEMVKQLKQSYNLLSQKLRGRLDKAYEDEVAKAKQKVKIDLEEKFRVKYSFVQAENDELHVKVGCLEAENSNLSEKIKMQKMEFEDILSENEKKFKSKIEILEKEHLNAISLLKTQYLDTLKSMRDDVSNSKVRSVEKFKREWEKKKEKLEEYWKGKVEEVCRRCHCVGKEKYVTY